MVDESWRTPLVPERPTLDTRWAGKVAKGIGVILIVFGSVSIIMNTIWLCIAVPSYSSAMTGLGFWIGFFLIVTGLLAALAGVKRTRCLIIATLILAILAVIVDCVVIGICTLQIAFSEDWIFLGWDTDTPFAYAAVIGLPFGATFMAIAVVTLVLLFAVSVLSCRGLCCKLSPKSTFAYSVPTGVENPASSVTIQGMSTNTPSTSYSSSTSTADVKHEV